MCVRGWFSSEYFDKIRWLHEWIEKCKCHRTSVADKRWSRRRDGKNHPQQARIPYKSVQDRWQERLPQSTRENSLRSDNVYLTATTMNAKNFFNRMVTGDETWIHPESKDYGVETYWLARNKESKTQSSTRKMMLIVFDDSLYWKTIWSEQLARNVEESVLVVWQYTPIYGRSNSSNWILRYRHTSPTAHISRLPAITSLDGSKMLYKIVDFLWIKKSKNRCFLEGIRNVVEHWNKRIEKEWDYVENGCTCLTDAFV